MMATANLYIYQLIGDKLLTILKHCMKTEDFILWLLGRYQHRIERKTKALPVSVCVQAANTRLG